MADPAGTCRGARRALVLVSALLAAFHVLAGCGDPPMTKAPLGGDGPDASPSAAARPPEDATEPRAWGKFHSKRLQLTIPLPDGRAWKIDDHRAPELVAVHAATSSRLVILATREEELMNRQRCEERARARGWVTNFSLTTVEDEIHIGPDAYDSRVWVAIDTPKDGGLEGHVFLFGAFLRRCLLVHLSTSVPSGKDEDVLASRLAVGSARIVKAISIAPPRTTDDAVVPRDRPEIRR